MLDENDYSDPSQYTNNKVHMQHSAQGPPPASYELDLQQYMQMKNASPQP